MLSIKDLSVSFRTRKGEVNAVRGVSFEVAKGETLGIVGESGSGKSVTSYALMRILDAGGRIKTGDVTYDGIDLRRAAEREMQDIRGREISMIFQNPRAALNPIRRVGHQIEDVLIQHAQATRQDAREKAIQALEAVKIRDAEARYHAYPFELSGGMCQRVVIAIALACNPRLLVADEPTTGLDITTQKAVMDLVRDLTRDRGMSSILITHDLGLAAQYCDRIVVMNAGRIEDQGSPARIYRQPATLFAAGFMGEMNRIPARVTGSGVETPFGTMAITPPAAKDIVLCLRPEAIRLGEGALAIGPARVRDAAFFGTHCRAHLVPEAAPDLTLVAHLPPDSVPSEGTVLTLAADTDAISAFAVE